MTLLQRIGFRSGKVRPVGNTLETGDSDQRRTRRVNVALKSLIIAVLFAVTMLAFPQGQLYQYTVQVDDIWRQENLMAPFTFPIQKSDAAIAREREQIRLETPQIFQVDSNALAEMAAAKDSLEATLQLVFDLYAGFQGNLSRGRLTEAAQDSLAFTLARDRSGIVLTRGQWNRLLDSYTATVPGLASRSRSGVARRIDQMLFDEVWNTISQLATRGILDLPADSILASSITIRNTVSRSERTVAASSVYTLDQSFTLAQNAFRNTHLTDPDLANISTVFFSHLLRPTYLYDRTATENLWKQKEREISPTENIVRQNEVIIRKGDKVTAEIQRKLLSLEDEQNERSGTSLTSRRFTGQFILAFATYLIFFLYLYLLRRPIFDDNNMILLVALLFLGVVGMYGVALRAALLDMYVVPVAIVGIVLTVVFDSRVALFGILTLAFIGSHLLNFDFLFTFSTVFAGTLGIFSVRDIRNRGQFFLSSGLVFAGYLLVLTSSYLLQGQSLGRFSDQVVFVAINSVLLLLAYPSLWLFERFFGLTTDLTLLELSDTNRPLLKELSLKAPGTFNHVLQVANLAEAGATAVGANALLTRVGALYHDVGKMTKPEYFVENQRGGVNPHDQLKPSMSALIISSHVKEGLEIARKYRIPQRVLDFIPMHHGTTRIEYFYQRALDGRKKGDPEIQEVDFRYPGPKPNTVETSLLMLADTVEAAARTLDNPTHKRLEGLIEGLFEARMEDGQLDNSGLTFSDLNRIKETFLTMLVGFYHVRVKYPGDEEDSNERTGAGGKRNGDVTKNAEGESGDLGPVNTS